VLKSYMPSESRLYSPLAMYIYIYIAGGVPVKPSFYFFFLPLPPQYLQSEPPPERDFSRDLRACSTPSPET
jgi:hypothetical protein